MSGALPGSRSDSASASAGLPPLWRAPLLVLGFAALIVGVGAGLARLAWNVPVGATSASLHGVLMICGFFGVVISLERAVAIGRAWAYLGPLLAASIDVLRRQAALFTFTLMLGRCAGPSATHGGRQDRQCIKS